MSVLGSKEIRRRILEENLIENYIDLDVQTQPSGFDFTVGKIGTLLDMGAVDFDNTNRWIPPVKWFEPQHLNIETGKPYWFLKPGVYVMIYNEKLNLPLDLMGDSFHRSSLMRCGVLVNHGRWDPGYSGMGRSILIVHNPHGFQLYKNARVTQIKFYKVEGVETGYSGRYQKEKLT